MTHQISPHPIVHDYFHLMRFSRAIVHHVSRHNIFHIVEEKYFAISILWYKMRSHSFVCSTVILWKSGFSQNLNIEQTKYELMVIHNIEIAKPCFRRISWRRNFVKSQKLTANHGRYRVPKIAKGKYCVVRWARRWISSFHKYFENFGGE